MIKLAKLLEESNEINFDWDKRTVSGSGLNVLRNIIFKTFFGGKHASEKIDFSKGGMMFTVELPEYVDDKMKKKFAQEMKKMKNLKFKFYEEDDEQFVEIEEAK